MYARGKQNVVTSLVLIQADKRINISTLKGDARRNMWSQIQTEHPALAEDLQGGACQRIRSVFPDIEVIVSLDKNNRIMKCK